MLIIFYPTAPEQKSKVGPQ